MTQARLKSRARARDRMTRTKKPRRPDPRRRNRWAESPQGNIRPSGRANPNRADLNTATLYIARRGGAFGRRRRMPAVNKGDAPAVCAARHTEGDAGSGEDACANSPHHALYRAKAKNVIALSQNSGGSNMARTCRHRAGARKAPGVGKKTLPSWSISLPRSHQIAVETQYFPCGAQDSAGIRQDADRNEKRR